MSDNSSIAEVAETNGIAYQIVAQATGIAIQDAADNLRYITTVSASVQAAALALILATDDLAKLQPMIAAIAASTAATAQFTAVGVAAANVLTTYRNAAS